MELVDGTLKSKEWAKAEEKLAVLKRKSGRLIAAVGRKVEKGVPLNCCVRIVAFLVYRTCLDAWKHPLEIGQAAVNGTTSIERRYPTMSPPVSYLLAGEVNAQLDQGAVFVVLLIALFWNFGRCRCCGRPLLKIAPSSIVVGYLLVFPLLLFVPLALRLAHAHWNHAGFVSDDDEQRLYVLKCVCYQLMNYLSILTMHWGLSLLFGPEKKEKPAAAPAVYTIPLPPTAVPKSTVFDV